MSGLERRAYSRAQRSAGIRLLLGGAILLALGSCRSVDQTLEKLHLPCGVYRWSIKILMDPDQDLIRWKAATTTVHDLVSLPRPPADHKAHHRAAPELQVYRVRAVVMSVHPRVDQDLHLVLRDPNDPEAHMLGEIPDPRCAPESKHTQDFDSARRVAQSIRARGLPARVEVWGVGFFDAVRDQIGGAPNGFELHPIVGLKELEK